MGNWTNSSTTSQPIDLRALEEFARTVAVADIPSDAVRALRAQGLDCPCMVFHDAEIAQRYLPQQPLLPKTALWLGIAVHIRSDLVDKDYVLTVGLPQPKENPDD